MRVILFFPSHKSVSLVRFSMPSISRIRFDPNSSMRSSVSVLRPSICT